MSREPVRDLNVRREAIFTTEHAFVWASAGTGKTHTLTLRALYLLLDLGHSNLYLAGGYTERHSVARKVIRSLVLTTFTRKAAAEMHERLYVYLDTVAQAVDLEDLKSSPLAQKDPIFIEIVETILERIPGQSFSYLKAGSQALTECASELQISTIHSLAASILKRHPFEAGIQPGVRFAKEDEDDVDTFKEQLLERWWQEEAFGNPKNDRDLSRILLLLPVSELRHWLDLACQTPWLADELTKLSPPRSFAETLDCLGNLASALGGVNTGKARRILTELNSLLARIKEGGDGGGWTQLTRFLFAQKDYLFLSGKQTPKAIARAIKVLPLAQRENLETYLTTYSVCLRAAIHFENSEIWETWLRFLGRFLEWVNSAAADELGVISFDDMINKAGILLKTNEEVRRFEFGRLQALLVDEFQDTDPAQLDLVASLLRRPPGCKRDVLGFFVGDTKQSIYRFRGVDILSVLSFFEDYETLTRPLRSKQEFHLQTNFRSCMGVTSFANHFFSNRLDLADESDQLLPFRDEMGPLPRWIQLEAKLEKTGISAEENRHLAAEATAATIEDYVHREGTNTRYQDFLVLTRNNRELDSLLPVLQEAGIPVTASGARTYYQHHEVLDLLNLLIALYHPFDSVAVAAVLRSPLIHLSDDEIHRLLGIIPSERLFHFDDVIPDFIPRVSNQRICELRRLAAMRRESPLYEWLQDVQAFIPAAVYTRPHDSEGRAIFRMSRLLKSLREEALNGNCPPVVWLLKQRSRARAVDRWDEDCGEDVNLFDEGVDAVRAMTIHKAKGLEARIVIIYSWALLLEESLGARNGFRGRTLDLTKADGSRLTALSLQWGPVRIVTDSHLEAVDLEARYCSEEAMRLTYVAVTRACDQLVLLQWPSKQLEADHFHGIWSDSGGQAATFEFSKWTPQESVKKAREPSQLTLDVESHRLLWDKRREALEAMQPILRHPTDLEFHHEPAEIEGGSTPSSLATGSLVHAYLEKRLRGSFDKPFLEDLWKEFVTEHTDSYSIQQATDILTDFYAGNVTDNSGLPLCKRVERSNILGQEIPVFLTIGQQAWHGVIDLIMEDEGVIYAIDFKTGPLSHPFPDVYAQQEMVYGEAIRRLFPSQEVRFEFWWLGTGDR